MNKLFRITSLSIILCFILSVSSHAVLSEIYDLMEEKDVSLSVAYKAKLKVPFSQLENWTNKTISFKISYVIYPLAYENTVHTSPEITIEPHQMRIFSPDDLSIQTYSIYQVEIMPNKTISANEGSAWSIVQHVCFLPKRGSVQKTATTIIQDLKTINIQFKEE